MALIDQNLMETLRQMLRRNFVSNNAAGSSSADQKNGQALLADLADRPLNGALDYDDWLEGKLKIGLGILNDMFEELSGNPCPLQLQGQRAGEIMVDPKEKANGLSRLEKKYEGNATFLQGLFKEIHQRENALAKVKIAALGKDLDTLEKKLDESQEGSQAAIILAKINKKEAELEAFQENVQDKAFFRQYKEVLEKRNQEILEEISALQSQVKRVEAGASEEFNHLRDVLEEFLAKFFEEIKGEFPVDKQALSEEPSDPDRKKSLWQRFWARLGFGRSKKPGRETGISPRFQKYVKHLQGIRALTDEFPLFLGALTEVFHQKEELLTNIKYDLMDNLEKLRLSILQDAPLILPRSQILAFYFVTFIIFGGEVYLIYAFLAETLNFDFKSDNFLRFTTFFGYVFCVAVPWALGFFYKEVIENPSPKLKRFERMIWLALFSIGLVNAMSIHQAKWIKQSDEVESVIDFLPQSIFSEDIFHLVSIFGIWMFLPILSLFFARVGAWTFIKARAAHLHYAHVTHQSLLSFRSLFRRGWEHQKKIEKEIAVLKDELKDLEWQREAKQNELFKAQALSKEHGQLINIKPVISQWKLGALAAFELGFAEGKGKVEQRLDETYMIRLKNIKKIFPEES
ncbi:MAG: hypothetical protein AAFR61_05490 [Bacteroidota bacterium]